jgi:hypothetical protein
MITRRRGSDATGAVLARASAAVRRSRYQRPIQTSTGHGEQSRKREPGDAGLPARDYDEGCEKRPDRLPEIAADLEERLSEAMPAAGRCPGDARGFRVEHGRAGADEGGRDDDEAVRLGEGEQQEAAQRDAHPDRERERSRATVGVEPDERLQQRRRELEGQRDQADLGEGERISVLQDRIDGGDKRLDQVVQQMGEAERAQHQEGRTLAGPRRRGGRLRGRSGFDRRIGDPARHSFNPPGSRAFRPGSSIVPRHLRSRLTLAGQ